MFNIRITGCRVGIIKTTRLRGIMDFFTYTILSKTVFIIVTYAKWNKVFLRIYSSLYTYQTAIQTIIVLLYQILSLLHINHFIKGAHIFAWCLSSYRYLFRLENTICNCFYEHWIAFLMVRNIESPYNTPST